MRTYFAVLIWSAVAAFLLTPLARQVAFQWGAIDLPNERKIHNGAMPRLGGLAVFWGFCFPWLAFYFLNNPVAAAFKEYEALFGVLMLGALAMLGLGIYDDVKGVKASKKFIIQIAVAVMLVLGGFRITELSSPFGPPWALGWVSLPISVLWIVGITNAINLLDGIDGLVTGVTACISLSLALINIMTGNIIVALLTLCLAGACLGFLPYNFSPARIFLGDSGSLFIGLILSCIGILSLFKAATASFVLVPLILFGLPLYDTTTVMLGRMRRGQPVFQADKSHVHHRLLKKGFTQKQAAWTLYGVTVVLGALSVLMCWQNQDVVVLAGLIAVTGVGVASWWAWKLYVRKVTSGNENAYVGTYRSPKPHFSSDPTASR